MNKLDRKACQKDQNACIEFQENDLAALMDSTKLLDLFEWDSDIDNSYFNLDIKIPGIEVKSLGSEFSVESQWESEQDAKDKAMKLIKNEYREIDYKEYLNYLSRPENKLILRAFVRLLSPLPVRLYDTIRKVSLSIYFIGGARAIDAVLEEVSLEWISTHNLPHYENNYKLVHITLFSLLLLNSDLYNNVSQLKFSRDEFIDNTVYALLKESATLHKEKFVFELGCYYDLISAERLPLHQQPRVVVPISKSADLKKSYSSDIRKFQRIQRSFSDSSSTSSSSLNIRCSFSSTHSGGSTKKKYFQSIDFPRLYLPEPIDEQFKQENHPYWIMDEVMQFRESIINIPKTPPFAQPTVQSTESSKRTMLNWLKPEGCSSIFKEHGLTKKCNHKWHNARVIVKEGRLYIFDFKGFPALTSKQANIDMCKRKNFSYTVLNLFGASTILLQENIVSSTNDHKQWNFNISFPKTLDYEHDRIFHFQVSDLLIAHNFVNCVNIWSARITPIPTAQFEMVSNQEYGWSEKLLNKNTQPETVSLVFWQPLIGIESIYNDLSDVPYNSLKTQFFILKHFIEKLIDLIDEHNEKKSKIIKVWSHLNSSVKFDIAMDNWNRRYLFLNFMFEKHNLYYRALELLEKEVDTNFPNHRFL